MNKKLLIFLLAFFSVISLSDASENLAAKFYVQEGKKEFKAKEYDEAISQFRKALLAQPDNEEALMYLKMLGFGSRGAKEREQDPAGKISEETKSSSSTKDKTKTKKTEKKDVVAGDESVEAIETQINAEEEAALKDLRAQAAKEQKIALKKLRAEKSTSTSKASPKKNSKKIKAQSNVTNQAKTEAAKTTQAEVPVSADVAVKIPDVVDSVDSDVKTLDESVSEDASSVNTGVPQQGSTDDIKIPELAVDSQTTTKTTKSAAKSTTKPAAESSVKSTAKSAEKSSAISAATPAAKSQESATVKNIQEKAIQDKKALENTIDAETAKKIEQIHKKFESKPIGPNEKTTFRDFDEDGVPEEISLKESKLIEKIEQQAQEKKEDGAQKIMKQAAKDEKAALKKIRAKSAKKNKKAKISESQPSSEADVTTQDSVAEDLLSSDEMTEEDALSDEEAAILDEMNAELTKKEEDLRAKFAVKKALRISEVEKKSKGKPKVQEAVVELGESSSSADELAAAEITSDTQTPIVKRDIPPSMPKSMQAQNTVLKKKFAQVVDMSQKDQVLIKDLESDLKENEERVGALENNLKETQANLDKKVVLLNEKEEKLKQLSDRIAKMESDVNSNQYDFKDKQMEYEKKLQAIQEEFGNYKSERANTEDELKEQLKTLKEALAKKIAELNAVQEKLIFTENKLKASEEKNTLTMKQYDDMKTTLAELEGRLSGLQTSDMVMTNDEAPVVTLDSKNLPTPQDQNDVVYQQWIKRHDKLIERLKEKLLWSREQIEFLGRYDIKLNDQKMAALKEQLAEVKKQLNIKNTVGDARTAEDFALIEGRLKDSQERLDMVEKILSEKDDQIKELEDQLNKVLSAF